VYSQASEAIAATLPLGSVGYEAQVSEKGEAHIWIEGILLDEFMALRRHDESYSDVILRLAAAEHE
jgi:hypothetical protein